MQFSLVTPFFFLTLGAVRTYEERKRFKIVSEYHVARKFYPEIRATKPEPLETLMELKDKELICRDIINSHYIRRRINCKLDYKARSNSLFFKREALHLSPRKLATVALVGAKAEDEDFLEWVFACPVLRRNRGEVQPLYISEEYKIGGDVDSADNYVAGRFIFRVYGNGIYLDGLAEATAKIVTEDIENTYIERRTNQESESEIFHDPLCTSKPLEKIRICTAIFTSDHFVRGMDYPQNNWVDGSCRKRTVSFRKVNQEATASVKTYEEWMMDCYPFEDDRNREQFIYSLSQAYTSNEIFVYSKQPDQSTATIYHLEGRAVNIRFYA